MGGVVISAGQYKVRDVSSIQGFLCGVCMCLQAEVSSGYYSFLPESKDMKSG